MPVDVEIRISYGVGGAERRELDDLLDSFDQEATGHHDHRTASRVAGS
ncbi:MAG TPA: hypothetical protein VMN35_06035 [Gaiellaceae bacterium]|nr:hypothetical protein [Gaiellaceae bacterium]